MVMNFTHLCLTYNLASVKKESHGPCFLFFTLVLSYTALAGLQDKPCVQDTSHDALLPLPYPLEPSHPPLS